MQKYYFFTSHNPLCKKTYSIIIVDIVIQKYNIQINCVLLQIDICIKNPNNTMKEIEFTLRGGEGDYIQLTQLLKVTNCVASGSEAQMVVTEGLVKRNGETELRKRAKCVAGDTIEYDGTRIHIY